MKSIVAPGAFRLILAFLVIISHLSSFNVGRVAVILFFTLSGYWVKALWENDKNLYDFWINRILRIWPLYFICILLTSICFGYAISIYNILLFGVSSVKNGMILGVEWSLDIELQFYFILPFILWINGEINKKSSHILFLLPILIASVTGWILFHYTGFRNTLMYLPAFAFGMFMHEYNEFDYKINYKISLFIFCAIPLILLAIDPLKCLIVKGKPTFIDEDIFAMIWASFLIPWISASLKIKSSIWDRHIGNISYPLYLVHEPIIKYMTKIIDSGTFGKLISLSIIIIVTVIAYIILDIPLEKFRKNIVRKNLARSRHQTSHMS